MDDSSPPPRAPARTPSPNREKLIAAATALIVENGYGATGTEAIVRRAGVTRGALYYQFVDKEDLFRAVCASTVERVAIRLSDETMARARNPEDELEVGMALMLEAFADPEVSRILLVEGPAVLGFEGWRAVLSPLVLALLDHGLRHWVEVDRLPEAQVEPLANLFLGAIVQAAAAIGNAPDPEAARRRYAGTIAALLRGLHAAPFAPAQAGAESPTRDHSG